MSKLVSSEVYRHGFAVKGEAMPSPVLNRVYRDEGKEEEEEKKSQTVVVERVPCPCRERQSTINCHGVRLLACSTRLTGC
jgi:hypothetical protein